MQTRSKLGLISALLLSLVVGPGVRGDYVVKQDGTVLEGTVLKKPDGLWVKGKDGESQTVPHDQVKETGKGEYKGARPEAKPAIAAKPAAGAKPKAGKPAKAAKAEAAAAAEPTAPTTKGSDPAAPPKKKVGDYASTERRAKMVTAAMAAVTIWQEFIDSKPPAEDLKKAKVELAKWQKLAEGSGEKIKGKWVAGEERKAIVDKAMALYKEGAELMAKQATLPAIEKLKESVKIYPNDFRANFMLAFFMLVQEDVKDAKKYLDAAYKLRPNSPEVLANLALLEIEKRQYVKAIEMLYKAAQAGDNKAIVENLLTAINAAPAQVRKNHKLKAAIAASKLLGARYGVSGNSYSFVGLPDDDKKPGGPEDDPLAGGISSGTGFLISKDGLIVTNRHVVEHGKSFLVLINGKKQRSAEVIVMDAEQDLALIRVKPDEGEELPMVQLSEADSPGDGAKCIVMGYPMIDRLGAQIKITEGIVSSSSAKMAAGPDVIITAKVNPGNSGGPILDKYGNVMAVVSMKTIGSGIEDSYGLGISAGQARKFLAKNKVEVKAAVNAGAKELDTEAIAAKVKPATVCILATQ